jgi:glycosylphosphatidylinositol transamidase (GPIT) subunit GPI8
MEDYAVKLCQDICNVVNENPLPISIKYFIIKDIFNETEQAYNSYLADLNAQMQQKKEQQSELSEEISETKTVTIPIEDIPKVETTAQDK